MKYLIILLLAGCKTSEGRNIPDSEKSKYIQQKAREEKCMLVSKSMDDFMNCAGLEYDDPAKPDTRY